jgi:dTDP-4-dehydrorhamnose reductase
MSKIKVLVLGASGQMGQSLKTISPAFPDCQFIFTNRYVIDICSQESTKAIVDISPDFVINFAAYTAVDRAEAEPVLAHLCNAQALDYICAACAECSATLIHLSSDYVYHIEKNGPLVETDECHPKSVYGKSKLAGEEIIRQKWGKHIILRSSWLYSNYHHNFFKTILRLAEKGQKLSIVNDQYGAPTHCPELGRVIMHIIHSLHKTPDHKLYGTYNYTQYGIVSWFDFASEIIKLAGVNTELLPVSTKEYGAAAPRPRWSVMSTRKIQKAFDLKIYNWTHELKNCVDVYRGSKNPS